MLAPQFCAPLDIILWPVMRASVILLLFICWVEELWSSPGGSDRCAREPKQAGQPGSNCRCRNISHPM